MERLEQRERLIELLKNDNCPSPMLCDKNCKYSKLKRCYEERTADYLLANGVIVPPCKVGDDIYYINEYGKVGCAKKYVQGIIYLGGSDFEIMDMDENIDKIGTRYCFLSREEAEKALERMRNNG